MIDSAIQFVRLTAATQRTRRIVRYSVESVQAQTGTVSTKYLSTRRMEAGGGIERTKKNAFAIKFCEVTIARRAAWGRRWSRKETSEPAGNYSRSRRLRKPYRPPNPGSRAGALASLCYFLHGEKVGPRGSGLPVGVPRRAEPRICLSTFSTRFSTYKTRAGRKSLPPWFYLGTGCA